MTAGPLPRTVHTIAVLAAAAAVRAGVLLELSRTPLFLHPVVDAAWHGTWASRIASGDLLAFAPYFRAPLYPWLLGALYSITGPSVTAGSVMSMAISLTGCALFHRLALRLLPPAHALAAALLWALWGPAVLYSGTMLIEPLFITLLISSMLLLVRGRIASAALLLGLSAIARPVAVLLLPLVAWRAGRRRLAALLPFLAPVIAVWAVNCIAGDPGVVISSQGGINLYLGNGPEADGFTSFAPVRVPADETRGDNVWAASVAAAPPGLSESAVSAWWTRRTLSAVAADPVRWLGLMGAKILLVLSPAEIPSNYDAGYMTRYSTILGILIPRGRLMLPFSLLLLLLPAAFAGRPDRDDALVLLWTAALLGGTALFFVTGRFRLPAVPFMLLLAARGFARRPAAALRLLPAGMAAAVAGVLLSDGLVERSGVNMPFFDGLAHAREGLDRQAEVLFLESLDRAALRTDLDMNRLDAMHNLGLLAARAGRMDEAAGWWEEAVSLDPGFEPSVEALEAMGGR